LLIDRKKNSRIQANFGVINLHTKRPANKKNAMSYNWFVQVSYTYAINLYYKVTRQLHDNLFVYQKFQKI